DKCRVKDAARATTPVPGRASFAGRSRLTKRRCNQNRKAPFLDKQTGNAQALSTASGTVETSLNFQLPPLSANALHKAARRLPNLLGHVCLGRDKFRREP